MRTLTFLTVVAALAMGDIRAEVSKDVPYVDTMDAYRQERVVLDLYLPERTEPAPVLIWFHGGGLTGGDKQVGEKLGEKLSRDGIALAVPNYRLSPQAKFPAYVEDAAAAVAWVVENAMDLNIDPSRIYVGGHSAGGYLASLLAMDVRHLRTAGVPEDKVAGFIPVSGQMMTHFTVREEKGIPKNAITADEAAPIYFMRKNIPRMLILMGDKDWPARLEENAYFVAAARAEGCDTVEMQVIADRDHGSIVERMPEAGEPGMAQILRFIESGKPPQ